MSNESVVRDFSDKIQNRKIKINRTGIDTEARTVEIAFSSTAPYERYFGMEILSHESEAVDLKRLNNGGAVLADHDHTDQIGVIEKAWVDNAQVGRALIRFGRSERACEIFNDVADGIRRHISVGYQVHEMKLTKEVSDGVDEFTVTKWSPYEVSLTSIPADTTVGVGRSEEKMATTEDVIEIEKPKPKSKPKKETAKKPEPKKENQMSEEKTVDVTAIQEQARKGELHRVREIRAMGDAHKMSDNARSAIDSGRSIEEFRAEVLDAIASKPVSIETEIGMTPKEQRNYSMLRAVNAVVTGDWSNAELEREASDEVAKRVGKTAQGFFIPMDIQQRDVTTASGSGSGSIGTDNLGSSFIDLLRNSLKVKELGATVLGGLVGNVTVPALTTGDASYWVDENSAPTEGAPVLGQVALNPSTVGARVDLSRRFLAQSSFDTEAMFKNDLALSLATKIDLAAIAGSGTAPEPAGILNTTGIGAVDFTVEGAPTYAEIVSIWEEVAKDNGLVGNPAWLTNATLAGALMSTDSFSSAGLPILGDGKIMGYDCAISENVTANHIIFGNWADLVIGEWGAIDIAVDKASLSTAGAVRVVALHDVGIALRHASSFAHGD